jgi:diaminopimelate decarboxylase
MDENILGSIARKYGTPVYVYDWKKICTRYQMLRRALPMDWGIYYSVKANPLLGICQIMKQLGCEAEVASSGELYAAQKAGFSRESIIFTSPGKTYEELVYAISEEIGCINVETLDEALIISEIALQQRKTVGISLRINPCFENRSNGIRMSGIPSQFGIDEPLAENVINTIRLLPNIKLKGIQIYMSTQLLDADLIIHYSDEIINLARRLSKSYSFDLELLDLGGGFGVPYFYNERELDMKKLKYGMRKLWKKYQTSLGKTKVMVESGRYLLADSCTYLTRILYKKICRGTKYLVCDGGSHQHAASAFLGRYIRNNYPIHILGKEGEPEEYSIVGPLCTPYDTLGQRVMLSGEVSIGDIVSIEKSGAYGLTNSPVLFLSHNLPAEIIYKDGKTYILRERGRAENLLKGQNMLY